VIDGDLTSILSEDGSRSPLVDIGVWQEHDTVSGGTQHLT